MNRTRAQRTVARPRVCRAARLGTERFAPHDGFATFARCAVARAARVLAAQRPAAGTAPSPAAIHDLRVAARRLRVVLKLAGDALPAGRAAWLRAELKHFAASLGDARDLDVYAASLRRYTRALLPAERAQLRGYEEYVRRERSLARRRAAAACASERTATLFAELERLAAERPDNAAARSSPRTICAAARQQTRRRLRRVRRLGEELARHPRPAALHALRIKAKRLRYELELFAEALPDLAAGAAACKDLQDLLGAHQDALVAQARLRRYAALLGTQGGQRALPPALDALRRSQLAQARHLRRTFERRWPAFKAALAATRRAVG